MMDGMEKYISGGGNIGSMSSSISLPVSVRTLVFLLAVLLSFTQVLHMFKCLDSVLAYLICILVVWSVVCGGKRVAFVSWKADVEQVRSK
jgi:ABC-type long-subunit fatty acid transport system fused permease/ATPase subunit